MPTVQICLSIYVSTPQGRQKQPEILNNKLLWFETNIGKSIRFPYNPFKQLYDHLKELFVVLEPYKPKVLTSLQRAGRRFYFVLAVRGQEQLF